MRTMKLIRLFLFLILGLSISAHLTPKEKLKLHKAWLERRRAQMKSLPTTITASSDNSNTTDRSTYFRRIIKFKTDHEPENHTNYISFMPDQEMGGGGGEGDDNWSSRISSADDRNYKYDVITSSEEEVTTTTTSSKTITSIPERQSIIKKQEDNSLNSHEITRSSNDIGYSDEQLAENSINYSESPSTTEVTTTSQSATTPLAVTTTTDPTLIETTTARDQEWPTTTEEGDNWVTTTLSAPVIHVPITSTTTPRSTGRRKHTPPSLWNERNRRPLTVNRMTKTDSATTTSTPPTTSTPKVLVASGPKTKRNYWGPWSAWSDCTRSCGGGVRSQQRTCLKRTRSPSNATILDCIGFYKRYRICNDQPCPEGDKGFRDQQCSQFNTHTFKGKQYTWEPFIKADAECELNCKPLRLNYFATLNNTVIDGTPCTRPPEFYRRNYEGRAVCVEGVCKAVHNSGVIVGAYMNNGAVRCGPLICRPVTGIFTQTNLSNGYHVVATIPSGASNISITEMKNSLNFLVLKSESQKYIINGDFSITPSGIYDAAGTVFDYKRIDTPSNSHKKVEGVTEWITAMGPTTEPIHLMVLIQHHNPGIKYEYLLPINPSHNQGSEEDETVSGESDLKNSNLKSGSASETTTRTVLTRRRKFSWKIVKFAPCSKTCGVGTQQPIIKCVREGSTKISPPKKCVNQNKPVLNENQLRCNTQPCPAYWKVYEWTECNCAAEDDLSVQTRDVRCVQELANDIVIQVHKGACVDETPDIDRPCDCPKPTKPAHHHNNHHHGSQAQNTGRPFSIMRSPRPHNGTVNRRPKKAGIWLTSDWMEQCSTECGTGVQHRSIFCDRAPPTTDRCDQRFTPDTSRQCSSEKKCMNGEWFTGQWSPCTGDCFNLTKVRFVYCIKDETIVNDRECDGDKPEELAYCELTDVKECSPKWHTSEWTDCTKACNEGTQRRVVKCLEPNIKEKHMTDSSSCLYSDRPIAFRTCNTHKCHEQPTTESYDPQVDLIQNDVMPECNDEFPNCHLVVKARLCHHSYYKQHCCGTCSDLE